MQNCSELGVGGGWGRGGGARSKGVNSLNHENHEMDVGVNIAIIWPPSKKWYELVEKTAHNFQHKTSPIPGVMVKIRKVWIAFGA